MLRLRKEIYKDETAGREEFEYCYIHENDYWVIDAAYCFNRCSHDAYYKNLQVTAFKIKHINPNCTIASVVESLKSVMNIMANSVHYPSVKEDEAEEIVKSIWDEDINSIMDYVHGAVRYTEAFKSSNSITKIFNLRTTEWKYPQVNELIKMTDEEMMEYNGIKSSVDAYLFKVKLSSSKKLSYANKVRGKIRADKTDSLIKNTIIELRQDQKVDVITESFLYSVLSNYMSRKILSEGVKRLQESNCVVSGGVKKSNEAMTEDSIQKIRDAAYELHSNGMKVNKNKIHKAIGISLTTLRKRWHSVEEEINELNNKLK